MKPFSTFLAFSISGLLSACGAAPGDGVGTSEDALRPVSDIVDSEPADTAEGAQFVRGGVVFQVPTGFLTLAPTYSDLQLDGTMRFYGGGTPTLGLQIDVTNRGDAAAYGPSGRVRVAGVVLNAALYQYFGGSSSQPNTVNPNERGYIKVEVPATLLVACQSYSVQIDLDHTMQAGDAAAYANDSGTVSTTCPLAWTTPIDTLHLGHPPDPLIQGKTLQNIVSSVYSARSDNLLCSACHNSGSPASYAYRPNVAPNVASAPIDPFMFIGGNEGWACGGNPWASQLANLPATTYPKPAYLKEVFQKWITDGGMR